MEKYNKKFFNKLQNLELPPGLFEKIVLAIKKEKEFQKTKRLLFSFLFLSIVSIAAMPFSFGMLMNQLKNSGIFYFVSATIGEFGTFVILWQDFTLAILESLPIVEIIFFTTNLIIFFFAVRFFLNQKKLLA